MSDLDKLKCEEVKIVTQQLLCLQKAMLSNEALVTGVGTRTRYSSKDIAFEIYNISRHLYEHSISYAKTKQID